MKQVESLSVDCIAESKLNPRVKLFVGSGVQEGGPGCLFAVRHAGEAT